MFYLHYHLPLNHHLLKQLNSRPNLDPWQYKFKNGFARTTIRHSSCHCSYCSEGINLNRINAERVVALQKPVKKPFSRPRCVRLLHRLSNSNKIGCPGGGALLFAWGAFSGSGDSNLSNRTSPTSDLIPAMLPEV